MAPGYKPAIMAVLENFVDLLAGACMHYVLPWPARCLALNVCLPLRDRQCSECCSEELGRRCTRVAPSQFQFILFLGQEAREKQISLFPTGAMLGYRTGTRTRVSKINGYK